MGSAAPEYIYPGASSMDNKREKAIALLVGQEPCPASDRPIQLAKIDVSQLLRAVQFQTTYLRTSFEDWCAR